MTITAAHWKKSFYCWLCFCGLLPRYPLLVYLQFLCSWSVFPSMFWNCSLFFIKFHSDAYKHEFFFKNYILFQVFLNRKFDYSWNYGKLYSNYLTSFCLHYYLSENLIRYLVRPSTPFLPWCFNRHVLLYFAPFSVCGLHLNCSVFNSCYLNLISISWFFSAISNKLFYIIHPALNFSYYTFPLFYHLYHFLLSYSLFLKLSFYLTHETRVFYILTFNILICSVFGDDFIVFVVWVSFILPYVFFLFLF